MYVREKIIVLMTDSRLVGFLDIGEFISTCAKLSNVRNTARHCFINKIKASPIEKCRINYAYVLISFP